MEKITMLVHLHIDRSSRFSSSLVRQIMIVFELLQKLIHESLSENINYFKKMHTTMQSWQSTKKLQCPCNVLVFMNRF